MQDGRKSYEQIPNRWLYCPRNSNEIIGDIFIAFKTPLSDDYSNQMPVACTFTPQMLFDYCKRLNFKLGLWIDLTNTKRYYDKKVVEANGAKYIKMQCRGHNEVPTVQQTNAFIEIVEQFKQNHPSEIVGVHCTHGFNRTGFLIVSYLVDRVYYSVCDAVKFFANARPPGIYKQSYIDELFIRYQEENVFTAPKAPDWSLACNSAEHNNYNEHYPSSSKGTSNSNFNSKQSAELKQADEDDNPKSSKATKQENEDCQFMENVPGVTHVIDKSKISELKELLNTLTNGKSSDFPGCQPVSMDQDNIHFLRMEPYMVSWKADGIRYMMLIKGRKEVYFIDRKFAFYEVSNITFPLPGDLKNHLHATLIDGEMVMDNNSGEKTPRFLIFDIVSYCNENVGCEKLPERLKYIHKIVEARTIAFAHGLINRNHEPFGIRKKEFFDISLSQYLLSEFPKKLLHKLDGLLYQPRDDAYKMGVCDKILKWKPPELNTIDFLLKIKVENKPGYLPKSVGTLHVDFPNTILFAIINDLKNIKHLNNKIVECYNENGAWKVLRERTDKSYPNSYKTAMSIIKSITKPVKKEDLLYFIDCIKSSQHCRQDFTTGEPVVKLPAAQQHNQPNITHLPKHAYQTHPYQRPHGQRNRPAHSQKDLPYL